VITPEEKIVAALAYATVPQSAPQLMRATRLRSGPFYDALANLEREKRILSTGAFPQYPRHRVYRLAI
jgi:hypothetical protein